MVLNIKEMIKNNKINSLYFILRRVIYSFILIYFVANSVHAEQTLDGMYYDWSVFTLNDIGEEQKCYVVSFPKKSIGNYKNKREPYVLITKFKDKNVEEISIYSGFEYKIGSDIYISIDGKQYTLFTKDDIAWAKNKEQDKEIITNLLNGYSLKIRAESSKSEYVVDEYSLKGLTRAYKRMKELCK